MLKRKKKEVEEPLSTFQFSTIPSEALAVTEKDFISPTIITETQPHDIMEEGIEAGDYYVVIGTTSDTKRYFRTLYCEITGGNTYAGMFDKLYTGDFGQGNLDVNVDVALHNAPLESSTELDKINARIRGIKSDLYKPKLPDEKRIKLQDELHDLTQQADRLRLNIQKAFKLCVQVVVSSNNLSNVKKMVNLITRRLSGNQIIMRAADGKQLDALFNLLPIKDDPSFVEHTYTYETQNVADMFMFGNGKISHRSGIVWGIDHMGRPIMYDAWDKTLMNRNAIITGTSGGGKTVSACKLMHHDVLRGVRHAIICPKGDYRRYVEAMGCAYFDFGVKSDKRINFFDVDIEELDVDGSGEQKVNLESTITAASAIIFKMVRVYDETLLGGIVKRRIEDCIRDVYRDRGITKEPISLYEGNERLEDILNGTTTSNRKKMPQLSDVVKKIADLNQNTGDQNLYHALNNVVEILKGFTQEFGTPERAIFDCQSNVNINDVPMFAFGLAELDRDIMLPIGLFISTKWLATKFSHKNRHIRKRVVVDEAQVIMADNETAAWLENEFRIVRFFNTSMFALTQGYEVFARSDYGMGILKNAPTKLFLKQDKFDELALKEKFNLTAHEVSFLIEEARSGLGILRLNEERSIIRVTLTPFEDYLFETDPNKLSEKRAIYEATVQKKRNVYVQTT